MHNKKRWELSWRLDVTSINQAFFQVWFPSKIPSTMIHCATTCGFTSHLVTKCVSSKPETGNYFGPCPLPVRVPKDGFHGEFPTKPNGDYLETLTGPGQNPSNYCIVIWIFQGFFIHTLLFICHGHFTKIPGKKAKKTHFESLLGEMRTRQVHKFNKLLFGCVCVLGQVRNAKNKSKNNNKKEQSQGKTIFINNQPTNRPTNQQQSTQITIKHMLSMKLT